MIMVASVRYLTFRKIMVRLHASWSHAWSDLPEEYFYSPKIQHRKLPCFALFFREFVWYNFPDFRRVVSILKYFLFKMLLFLLASLIVICSLVWFVVKKLFGFFVSVWSLFCGSCLLRLPFSHLILSIAGKYCSLSPSSQIMWRLIKHRFEYTKLSSPS